MTSTLRWLAAVVLLVSLAACAPSLAPTPPPPPPLKPPAPAGSCYEELDGLGITYKRQRDFHEANGCGIDQNVRVDRSPLLLDKSAEMSCRFAVTLGEFEIKVVEPAAKRILGTRVTELEHFGTYACRGERGGDASRLSEHAHGRAIDIAGFKLEGGGEVSVRTDWAGDGPKARFLHEVAKGACGMFGVVITPNHNSFHLDHIHVDTGPYKFCGM